MPYVSCVYAPASASEPPKPDGERAIICTDESGVEWFLNEDSLVGDWLRFKEGGGQIEPYDELKP